MERFSLAGGQGWLTIEESGGRARCAAELPEDGKGLYKGYLCGTGGRALLGTFLPEDGRLKLRRTLSLDELRRQGAWPPTGARAELAFSAGSPGGPHSPEGWHWEEAPARRMGEPLLARAAGGGAGAVPAGTGGVFPGVSLCGDAGVSADASVLLCPRGTDEWGILCGVSLLVRRLSPAAA